jgi:hypothetical protein
VDKAKDIADLLRKEVEMLPGFVKWSYFLAISLFALLSIENNLNLFSTGLAKVIFILAFVLLVFPTPVWYLCFLKKRAKLRAKYPLSQLGKDYHIVDESGVLFLIDTKDKEIRWVSNLITAVDLNFALYRESFMKSFYPYPSRPDIASLCNYAIKEEILTRGRQGT